MHNCSFVHCAALNALVRMEWVSLTLCWVGPSKRGCRFAHVCFQCMHKKARIAGISVGIPMLAAPGSTQVIRRKPQRETE